MRTQTSNTKRRHQKVIKQAKGFRGRAKNTFRMAVQRVEKGLQYAYRDRRTRKRDFRKLWIIRINAAARMHDMSYSVFMNGVKLAGIEADRKILAHLAMNDEVAFAAIAKQAKDALSKAA